MLINTWTDLCVSFFFFLSIFLRYFLGWDYRSIFLRSEGWWKIVAWIIVRGIQKIDGKMAQQASTHRGSHKWICSPWWKMVGGRSEIRLDAFDIKKSMISFETRRDDSRIYLISFCSSSRYAARSYSVPLIIECAIIARVCIEGVSYRSLINADCKIHSCYPSCETYLTEATLQSIIVAVHGAGN